MSVSTDPRVSRGYQGTNKNIFAPSPGQIFFTPSQGQIFSEGVSTRSHIVVVCYTAISHIGSGTYVL